MLALAGSFLNLNYILELHCRSVHVRVSGVSEHIRYRVSRLRLEQRSRWSSSLESLKLVEEVLCPKTVGEVVIGVEKIVEGVLRTESAGSERHKGVSLVLDEVVAELVWIEVLELQNWVRRRLGLRGDNGIGKLEGILSTWTDVSGCGRNWREAIRGKVRWWKRCRRIAAGRDSLPRLGRMDASCSTTKDQLGLTGSNNAFTSLHGYQQNHHIAVFVEDSTGSRCELYPENFSSTK